MVKQFTFFYDLLMLALEKEMSASGKVVGARWSGKSKALLEFAIKCLFIGSQTNKMIKIYWSRYKVDGAVENFNECLDLLQEMEIEHVVKIKKTERIIVMGNCEIRFLGYKSSTSERVAKLGIKRTNNTDLVLWIVDEISQFNTKQEIQDIREAIGDAKSFIELFATNPWSKFHFFIKDLIDKITINNELLDNQGYQFEDKWIDETTYEFIFWTNHRVNEFLSPQAHKKLIDLWKTDPIRAAVVERGEMGVEQGGIYTPYLNKVHQHIPYEYTPNKFRIGTDVGITRDATASYCISRGQNGCYAIHGEYYHSHQDQLFFINGIKQQFVPKSHSGYASDIILFTKEWDNKENFIHKQYEIDNFVDNTSPLYQTINELAPVMNVRGINARPCIKPPIQMRIDAIIFLMSSGRMFIDKVKCPMLWKELNMSMYEEGLEKKQGHRDGYITIKRLDGKDHGINAMEYAFDDWTFDIIDNPIAELYRKKY